MTYSGRRILSTLVLAFACGPLNAQDTGMNMTSQVAIFTVPIFLIAFIYFFFIFSRQRREVILQREKVELEMRALRAQINPHFIFNCLQSIQSFIQENEIREADRYLVKFSYLMRRVLENSLQELISLAEDLKILDTYIELERMRASSKFTYRINNYLEESENLLVLPLILQPIVENAIIHGVATNPEDGHIGIELRDAGNKEILVTIEDNGKGKRDGSQVAADGTKNLSLGSTITQDRLTAMNEKERSNARIEIEEKKNEKGEYAGRIVKIYLPLISAYDE